MKKINLITAIALFFCTSLLLPSCFKEISGKGEIVTQTREIDAFEEVECENSADVEIYEGSTLTVEASDYENIVEFLETNLEGNRLVITTHKSLSHSEAKVVIHTPHPLRLVRLSGSGNITLKSGFNDLVNLDISGSGNISGEAASAVNDLQASNSGSGNISFKGTASKLDIDLSGSGDIDFTDTQALEADCHNSGSGNIYLTVSDLLNAVLSGSGNIEYYGNPVITQSNSGSGDIIHH